MHSSAGQNLRAWLAMFACLVASLVPARGLTVCMPAGGAEGGAHWEFGLGNGCPHEAALDLAALGADRDPGLPDTALDGCEFEGECTDAWTEGLRDRGPRTSELEEAQRGDALDPPGGAVGPARRAVRAFAARAGPARVPEAWTNGFGSPAVRRHLAARRAAVLLV